MHVVIGGCGRVGGQLTALLARAGHTVSIIDKKAKAFERLPPGFEGQTYVGMVFDRETLEEAGIREAQAFIGVTNGDNSNILSARVAQEHYQVPDVVARIYDPRRAEIYQRLGIKTVASVQWAVSEISDMIFHGIEHQEFAIGSQVMLRLSVPAHMAGERFTNLEIPGKARVVAIDRMGKPMLPDGDTTFQDGDSVHVMVSRDWVQQFRQQMEDQH